MLKIILIILINILFSFSVYSYDKIECDTMVSVSLSTGFHHNENSKVSYKSSERIQEIGDLLVYDVYTTSDNDKNKQQRWLAVASKVYDANTKAFKFCSVVSLTENKINYDK